ncbi:hypothetical protein ACS3SW_11430 [Roseobacteraceae bacterium S113]
MSDQKENWWRLSNPIMWAVLATALFAALLAYLGQVPTCNLDLFPTGDCPAKWRHIVAAPINEVGDTLAGLAGVLAFIWLVATVLLQAHELREQRKEFREQREATQDMAKAMAAQAAIFDDERVHRQETRAKDLLHYKLQAVLGFVRQASSAADDALAPAASRVFFSNINQSGNETDLFASLNSVAAFLAEKQQPVDDVLDLPVTDDLAILLLELQGLLLEIMKIKPNLSQADQQRLSNLQIAATHDLLDQLLKFTQRSLSRQ